jgi:beta-phosphoglucomutase-like phosphatase (HAD superfamily)
VRAYRSHSVSGAVRNMTTAASCYNRLISHVLFDMDGLLLDTEKFYTVVQEQILADYGKKFDWTLKAKMMGKKALEAGKILVQQTGLDGILSPEDFIKRREAMLHDMFPDSDLMPGIFSSLRFSICHAFANTSL